MKKITLAAALVLLSVGVFAQNLVSPEGRGPGMMGPGRGPDIDWKLGTIVTTEYKKLTGTITLDAMGPGTLKVDGVDYRLFMPRRAAPDLKTGDTLTVEGPVTTVKSDTKVDPFVQAFKITVNGKEIDVRGGRGNGFGDDDQPSRP